MITLLITLLGLAAIIYVIHPLVSKVWIPFVFDSLGERRRRELLDKKMKLYADIRDLDFDFGIGKLAENDYRALRQDNISDVAAVMKALESLDAQPGNGHITDDMIEHVIKSQHVQTVCPKCRFGNPAGSKFCSECGTKLT